MNQRRLSCVLAKECGIPQKSNEPRKLFSTQERNFIFSRTLVLFARNLIANSWYFRHQEYTTLSSGNGQEEKEEEGAAAQGDERYLCMPFSHPPSNQANPLWPPQFLKCVLYRAVTRISKLYQQTKFLSKWLCKTHAGLWRLSNAGLVQPFVDKFVPQSISSELDTEGSIIPRCQFHITKRWLQR